ncbi:MAG: hypothetical protein WB496_01335, partial [Pseudolabrys sp.]
MLRRQRLLQLLEKSLVRSIIAEPLLATADQRLVLRHTRVIDILLALTATVISSLSSTSITG